MTPLTSPQEPNQFIYQGQKILRWAFTQYLRHLFSNMKFLEDFKWDSNNEVSKIWIWSEYPQKDVHYPQIVVTSTPVRTEVLGFGDLSRWQLVEDENNDYGYYYVYTGTHWFTITLGFSSYTKDELEEVMDRVVVLLGLKEVRMAIGNNYGININIADGINASVLGQRNIPNTNQHFSK